MIAGEVSRCTEFDGLHSTVPTQHSLVIDARTVRSQNGTKPTATKIFPMTLHLSHIMAPSNTINPQWQINSADVRTLTPRLTRILCSDGQF